MLRKLVRVILSLGSLFFMLAPLQAGPAGCGKIEGYNQLQEYYGNYKILPAM